MKAINKYPAIIISIVLLISTMHAASQTNAVNFHKIGIAEGLHDGIIRCIAQDRFGYIWIGSVGAVNRFDGRKITQYTHKPGDTTSPYAGQPRSMHSDKTGRFWIGTESGLMEYDFNKGSFKRIAGFKDNFITAIESIDDSTLFLATRKGLFKYNTKQDLVFKYGGNVKLQHTLIGNATINSICHSAQKLFVAANDGLAVIDLKTDHLQKIEIPEFKNATIVSLSADKNNNIWICAFGKIKLARLSADHKQLTVANEMFPDDVKLEELHVVQVLSDKNGSTWLITYGNGLFQLQAGAPKFKRYLFNYNDPTGPSGNSYRHIFQDASGINWLGCDVEGVNYFDPGKNLFSTIFPFPGGAELKNGRVGRAMAMDKKGNIWMGNHDGLSRYNSATNQYTVWTNEKGKKELLYNTAIRSLLSDDEDNVWIGTTSGVNKYNAATGKIEFIDSKYLPRSYYNAITKDNSGNIWFCTNDSEGLYWYEVAQRKFHSISDHPQLKKFKGLSSTSYVMEDSRQRLWISFTRKGVVMLDKKTGQTKHYLASDSATNSIIGDLVIDIKEDKQGVIWITTFNGITGIDTENNKFISYNNTNGLPGNMAAPLAIDKMNRIWVGVNGGLTMISADRKRLTLFSLSDGLASVGFPEHAAVTTPEGEIMMPTNNGYVLFNPAHYKDSKEKLNFYLSAFNIFDKESIRINETDAEPSVQLLPSQNAFTLQIAALNYNNPSQTWFAYKLQGFEDDWHYSKDPKAVYTNLSGGNYSFLYKASTINENWDDVSAKKLIVHVGTYFYKSTWFKVLLFCIFALLLFTFFKYRTFQQKQVYQLKEKAQLLEKEKAMVMYENLKQQLNPHFLFNSLTSLNSLIEAEPKAASQFLDSLSKTYRYILKSRDNETVHLVDELRFAENYIKLQQTRFEKGFEVTIHIPEEYYHRKVVPVTLQNLVENAIKHNIIDEESPLHVHISIENDKLVVVNNLQKKKFVETSNRQGLANMQSLYHYLSKEQVEIIESDKTFTVKLPLL